MQHAKVWEPAEQTMRCFLSVLTYQIHRIVRHHPYNDMAQLLHQACEAEASVAEEAKSSHPTATRSRFSTWTSSASQPTVGTRDSASMGGSNAPTTAKSGATAAKSVAQPTMTGSGSTTSTARNRDMACHTCGGKGHFKRDCPNAKVMLLN
jgi:ubiquitin